MSDFFCLNYTLAIFSTGLTIHWYTALFRLKSFHQTLHSRILNVEVFNDLGDIENTHRWQCVDSDTLFYQTLFNNVQKYVALPVSSISVVGNYALFVHIRASVRPEKLSIR
ncbi:hypothetical protein BN874_390008 [Candidatus Contendobacter odensis Run_B_J11]|uniref:Uncharacterized protein n=1 Tax=Candidatus Contendobacter odensis Run_B_J11 TaxID=1400861 RepID=A0A7U7GDK3_9GAMM|nr:hypothetical protein BN874_390008 [Candidatus Contendobacter odensis Run_B_J11]